jgi:hypothetical protein
MKIFVVILFALFTGWCTDINKPPKEEPLAKVGDTYLYPSEIRSLLKLGLSKNDSMVFMASLIDKWIRKQLILQKAELNLTDAEKDVNKELDEYRTSLLIFKYEQKLLKEKLDTIVRVSEINSYYNQNVSNFILNYDIVKVLYIKLPLHSPNLEKVKEWIVSELPENIKLLEGYCIQFATRYDYFNDDWINVDNIKALLPFNASVNEGFRKGLMEVKDSSFYYFVNIKDIITKGSVSPLKFVEGNIKSVILLKRKQKLIIDLENRIYFDALKRNNFSLFNN